MAEAREKKAAKEALKPKKETVYIRGKEEKGSSDLQENGYNNEEEEGEENLDEYDDLLDDDEEVNRIMATRMAAMKKAVDTKKEGE